MTIDSKSQGDDESKVNARKAKLQLEPIPVYNPKVSFFRISF